jgi:hypothetical protein
MNPFIQLLERPVATLTLAAYAVAMLAISLGGLSYVVRKGATIAVLAEKDHRRGMGPLDEWWGDWAGGWIPPGEWVLMVWKVATVTIVILLALATVVHMVA